MPSFERVLIKILGFIKSPHQSGLAELGSILRRLLSTIASLLHFIEIRNTMQLTNADGEKDLIVKLKSNAWILTYTRKRLLTLHWRLLKLQSLTFFLAIIITVRFNRAIGVPEWLSWLASIMEAALVAPYVEMALVATFLSSLYETLRLEMKYLCYAGPLWLIVGHLAQNDTDYMHFAEEYGISVVNRPS